MSRDELRIVLGAMIPNMEEGLELNPRFMQYFIR